MAVIRDRIHGLKICFKSIFIRFCVKTAYYEVFVKIVHKCFKKIVNFLNMNHTLLKIYIGGRKVTS